MFYFEIIHPIHFKLYVLDNAILLNQRFHARQNVVFIFLKINVVNIIKLTSKASYKFTTVWRQKIQHSLTKVESVSIVDI